MKSYRYLFIGVLIPGIIFASTVGSQQCRPDGYTIATINGVFTNEEGAKENMLTLQSTFGNSFKDQDVSYQYLLNPTHIGGLGDLAMAIYQKAFENGTVQDYDLIEMLSDASQKVKTQKLLLVAHSQGNFYANSFYDTVADKVGGVPAQAIGIYSVANPADRVAGGGQWITSDTDKVIAGVVARLPYKKIMSPNTHIELASGDDQTGHGFSDVYLKYRGTQIVAEIRSSLDRLSSSPDRHEDVPCINPPRITIAHRLEGVALGAADNSANSLITTTVFASNAGLALANTTLFATSLIFKTAAHLASSAATSLAFVAHAIAESFNSNSSNNNTASLISALTSDGVPPDDMSLQLKVEQPMVVSNQPVTGTEQTASAQISEGNFATSTTTDQTRATSSVATARTGNAVLSSTIGAMASAGGDLGGGSPPQESSPSATHYYNGVTPEAPTGSLATGTTTFSGVYNNSATFDTIVFEIKNTSREKATSSLSRIIATSTGEGLRYNEKIILEDQGNWRYRVRLEDRVNATSTPWSALSYFIIVRDTKQTDPLPINSKGNGVVYQQTIDTARSEKIEDKYLIQTHIHIAEDPTWDIEKIIIRFNSTDDNILSENDCKWADISFPGHGADWNGTQNNIRGGSSSRSWYGVTITADDATKTCTYESNYGNLVSLSAGADYDMVFSSGSFSGKYMQIYGSPSDIVRGEFGHFAYKDNANPILDSNIADAYIILATSTNRVIPQGITPLAPINVKISTSTLAFSGTYRDLEGSFNRLNIEVEATSTIKESTIGKRYVLAPVVGVAVPFSEILDFPQVARMGMRWRVQAWDTRDWGDGGYGTQWNGTTGYSDWQYFTFEPEPVTATTTPTRSSAHAITSFDIPIATSTTSGTINETTHTVNVTVPFGTNVHTLVPTVAVSLSATSSPASLATQDFTTPVTYTVTAEDGSTQMYVATVTVGPDTTPPAIARYTFNGIAGDIATNFSTTTATITPTATLAITANKNVDWTSIKIEDQNNPVNNKIFYDDKSGCVNGTSMCTKIWNGSMSHGTTTSGSIYRIKVHLKDAAGNEYNDYLSPYRIMVN